AIHSKARASPGSGGKSHRDAEFRSTNPSRRHWLAGNLHTDRVDIIAAMRRDSPDGLTAGRAAFSILGALSICHLLNDMVQSLLPAIYPILKEAFQLDFRHVGL